MLDSLISIIAPHLCRSCGSIGTVLCDNCIYYIVGDDMNGCICCGQPTGVNGICKTCSQSTFFTRAWYVGERKDELRRLIDDYKFERVFEARTPLAMLLSQRIGELPSSVTIVPVPTLPSHIRQRGYDHALLLAEKLGKYQGVAVSPFLKRASRSVQRGATKKQRLAQAANAFRASKKLDGGVFLVVDDVVTTGATLNFAAKELLDAGADEVWVAVIARQPVDGGKEN